MKNRKGFTLIELLAVIVILAIIAVIAVPKILNMIEDARKSSVKDSAYGYVKSIENKIAQSSLKGITYEDREDYAYEDIKVDMKGTKPTYVRYSLKKGVVESGVFCIDDYIVNYTNKEVTVGERCNEDELKLPGSILLSETKGNYTYPTKGTFEIIKNISGGTLTCETGDSNIATCSIEGNVVTVTPGKKKGNTTLTVKSAATSKYKEAQVAYEAITAEGTLNSYTVIGYKGIYDGKGHGITVTSSGSTIKYGEEEGTYDKIESPTYSDVGTYTVYYQIETEGYGTVKGSETVEITKAEGTLTAPTSKTLTYTEKEQELINAGSSSTGEIQYKLNDGVWSTNIPKATNAETYTVYYKVIGDKNHNDIKEKSIIVTIAKAEINHTSGSYTGVYDGESHRITVSTTLSGATIKYGTSEGTYDKIEGPTYSDVGTYTVYYQITKEGYITKTGFETVEITKTNNTLEIKPTSANYTYPTSGTFEITKNTSGGKLNCTSSNTNIATCSISGTTVTVVPGTIAGTATLTIKSAATTNYNAGQTTFKATAVAIASNTVNGTTTNYTSLQVAFDSTTTGTVKLLKDTVEDIRLTNHSLNKTINLNNKMLNGHIWVDAEGAKLIVNGPGTIKSRTCRAIANTGILTVNNVVINGGTDCDEAVWNLNNGQMILSNSTIHSTGAKYSVHNSTDNILYLERISESEITGTLPIVGKVIMFKDLTMHIEGDYEFSIYNIAVTECPTWTDYNGQDDLVYHGVGSYTNGTGTYTYCRFNTSSHNNESGTYITHFYNGSTYVDDFIYNIN